MDRGHEGYCIADPLFFDDPAQARDDDVDFAVAAEALPVGWNRVEFEDWFAHGRPGRNRPEPRLLRRADR